MKTFRVYNRRTGKRTDVQTNNASTAILIVRTNECEFVATGAGRALYSAIECHIENGVRLAVLGDLVCRFDQ